MRSASLLALGAAAAAAVSQAEPALQTFNSVGAPQIFAPGIASTEHAEIRLTISPDGGTAMWFSRDRPGSAGGYDIWLSRRTSSGWGPVQPAPFNTAGREFDPAFSSDGRFVYFSSDRPGGLGGDDLYRVAVTGRAFGQPEHLGDGVNSVSDEFAPMLSRDLSTLLFSSDRLGGSGGHDLYVAHLQDRGFAPAQRVPGEINTDAHEFDATFLSDDTTILFARTPDFAGSRVDMFVSRQIMNGHEPGEQLDTMINHPTYNTYGAMIDWSDTRRLLFSARRDEAGSMDLYTIEYSLDQPARER